MGKSASGKDSVYTKLLRALPFLKKVVSYSTRPMRSGETEGETYHFVTEEFLSEAEKEGKLIESRTYQTVYGPWSYATVDDGQIDLAKGSYLITATLESFRKLREYFGKENVVPLYLEVEDGERLKRALLREYVQKKPAYQEMCRRFLADCEDFSEEKLAEAGIERRFQNDDVIRCMREIADLIKSETDARE